MLQSFFHRCQLSGIIEMLAKNETAESTGKKHTTTNFATWKKIYTQTKNNTVEWRWKKRVPYTDRFVLFIFNFKIYYITCDSRVNMKFDLNFGDIGSRATANWIYFFSVFVANRIICWKKIFSHRLLSSQ